MVHLPREETLRILAERGWVSLNQFLPLMGVTYPTALKMVKRGDIQAVRVGGIWRIYDDEANRFLREGNATGED